MFDDKGIDAAGSKHNTSNGTVLSFELEYNWGPESDESTDDLFNLSPDSESNPSVDLSGGFGLQPPIDSGFDLDAVGAGPTDSPFHWSAGQKGPPVKLKLGVGVHIDGFTDAFDKVSWPPKGMPSIPLIKVGPGDIAVTGNIELQFPHKNFHYNHFPRASPVAIVFEFYMACCLNNCFVITVIPPSDSIFGDQQ